MNAETKHTPGPWTIDGPPWNQIVWSGAENRVCFLAHSNGANDERDIATGRLIAAAPDLFEALLQCREYLRHSLGSTSEINPYPAIDAALLKAGG